MRLFKQRAAYGGGRRPTPSVVRNIPTKREVSNTLGGFDAVELKSFVYKGVEYTPDDFVSQRWLEFLDCSHLYVTLPEQVAVMFSIHDGVFCSPVGVTEVKMVPVRDGKALGVHGYVYMGATVFRDPEEHGVDLEDYYYESSEHPHRYFIVTRPRNGRKGLDTVRFEVDRSVGSIRPIDPGSGCKVTGIGFTATYFNEGHKRKGKRHVR